jgi:DNA-binding CsgD family transcriptional regulator
MLAGAAAIAGLSEAEHISLRTLMDREYIPPDPRGAVVGWLATAGRFNEALDLADQFFATPRLAGDERRVERQHSYAYDGIAFVHAIRGHPAEADIAYQRNRELRRSAIDPAFFTDGRTRVDPARISGESLLHELVWIALPYRADDILKRRQLMDEARQASLRFLAARGQSSTTVLNAIALPLLWIEGNWVEAIRLTQADQWQTTEDVLPLYVHLQILSALAYERGEVSLVQDLIHEYLPQALATQPGDVAFATATLLQRRAATLAIDAGDLHAAKGWLDAHDKWLVWSEAVLGLSEGQVLWAQYYRQAGNIQRAYEHGHKALERATEPHQPLAFLAVHRLLGELDTEAARFTDAETHLTAALTVADACAAPYERALTLLAQAELRLAEYRRGEATAILDEVRAILIPLGAKPALARADVLIAQLSGQQPALRAYPDNLTPREVDVLRLIAAGRSNREIAAALFISSRTVNRHIENLYRKIGAHGKADATAYAFRHHLA